MSRRSRSRSGARSPIVRGDVTDFEDIRTTPERERASSSAAAHDRAPRKLWSRTQLRRLPCPLDGLRQCFLRVTPPRRDLRHPDAELRRHAPSCAVCEGKASNKSLWTKTLSLPRSPCPSCEA